MAYSSPQRLNQLNNVETTIDGESLFPAQDVVGNALGYVRAASIIGQTTMDDIQQGTTYGKMTQADIQETQDLILDFNAHVVDYTNPHQTDKVDINLDQVDNTSDLAKPISTATQDALDLKINHELLATTTPTNISDMVFELTNDTTLTIKVKGSDGVVRSATLTMA